MMLDYYDYTGDEAFLKAKAAPLALEILTFFDHHYKTGADGKLVMHPSQALETWWDCTNPMPEVAGLHAVTARLLALPAGSLAAAERDFVAALRDKAAGAADARGRRRQDAGARREVRRQAQRREPRALRRLPVPPVLLREAQRRPRPASPAHRQDQGAFGWRQDDIFMAYLGLAEEAQENVVRRARKSDPDCRFPAFWGPNYDWTPDQDHGGVLIKAVQSMLLQTEGRKIFLLPAWPKRLGRGLQAPRALPDRHRGPGPGRQAPELDA